MATPTTTRVVPLVAGLAAHGERPALLTGETAVSYAELARRVADVADRLGPARRLVLLSGGNDVATLTSYLGALAAGCPVLLVPPGERAAAWVEAYDPDVVVTGGDLVERREHPAHELHEDLALLLTTSGSTGSPKLVRLSHDAVQANAEQVAASLGVRADDRALTTLPLHYSYGLSVVHSHLLRGAALVLTGLSVADACFWDLLERTQATTFAGVPYVFDLLERSGGDRDAPSLRYVTCAGGRLAPDRVRHWAQVGRRRGWDLVVMYGQTEATARMAVLPAGLALEHPDAVGVAVPGGAVRLDPVDGAPAGVGEVVYTGPNTMLGYAERPADLALGRTVDELRTGDLGRVDADGLLRLVGRRDRVAKVFGLRLDLAHLEAELARDGLVACLAHDDGQVVAAAEGSGDDDRLRARVAAAAGLPPRAVRAAHVGALPRKDTGKPDPRAVPALVPAAAPGRLSTDLRALYADVLERDVCDTDSFVSAGGDSLSYVELSLRLEEALGHLPPGWHTTAIGDLRPAAGPQRRTLETSVALRALAIVLVVCFHSNALAIVGGAHVLIGVAGFNLARFGLSSAPRTERLRHLAVSAARIAVPTVVVAGAVAVTTGAYGLATVLQVNALLGDSVWSSAWQLWFVEALLQLLALVALLVAVPALDRLERARPFATAAAVVGAGLAVRYDLLALPGGPDGIHTSFAVLWLFGLGWAAARAHDLVRRTLVTAVLLLALPGAFDDPRREAVVAVGLLALVWLRGVPCPSGLRHLAGVLASSSLYVYLTHWQVYPHLEVDHPWLGVLASLVVGVATWRAVEAVTGRLRAYGSTARTVSASTQRR